MISNVMFSSIACQRWFLLRQTPAVLSVGARCRKLGWLFFWIGVNRPRVDISAAIIVPVMVKGVQERFST